jgi:serine/threonine-protein kinase
VVKDNGSVLQPVVFGTALPVDPGVHHVEASAPGYLPWSKEVKVDDHAANLQLEVPALVKDPNAVVATAPSPSETAGAQAGAAPTQSAASTEPATEERMSTLRIVGIALGSAGIVGIGVGAVLGGLAMSNGDDVEKLQKEADTSDGKCPDDACADKLDDARKQANASTALWIVGGALLAGGIITFVLAPKYQETKPTVAMYADPRGAGLSLRGAF